MKHSLGSFRGALTVFFLLEGAVASDRTAETDSYALQYDFGIASDLVIEPRWQNVPPDMAALLGHVARNFVVGKPGFANVGEEWSSSDFLSAELPQSQHLFSAYSDKVAASVFLLGGHELTVYALLARRRAKSFCIFRLQPLALSNLRASIIQDVLRPDRDQTISPIPKCQPQSLGQALQLPSS